MEPRIDTRTQALYDLGLKYNGAEFYKDDFSVHWIEMTCDTDEEFNKKIENIKAEMARRALNNDRSSPIINNNPTEGVQNV
jgi:hypothetical protein